MNLNKIRATCLLILMAVPGLAQADWYVGGAIGQAKTQVSDFRFHNPDGAGFLGIPGAYVPMNSVSSRDDTSLWSLRLGYIPAGTPWRFEFDGTRRSGIETRGFADFAAIGGGNFRQDLRVRSDSYLLMAYYDHPLQRDWGVYGGLGLGQARNRSEGSQGLNLGGTGYFPKRTNSATALAFAFGLNHKLAERVTIDLGYRYVDLGSVDTGTTDASFGALVPFAMNPNERLEGKLRSHEIRLGLNYRF